jgi:ABC-type transporter Mla subunit MlaD
VGTVKSIRLKPEIKDHPVEVRLQLRPPDQLKIPRDATVGLETAGILGETFVDVGIQRASGPALRGGEVLVSDFSPSDTLTRLRQFFGAVQKTMEAAKSASCPQPEKAAAVPGPVHKEASKAPTSR